MIACWEGEWILQLTDAQMGLCQWDYPFSKAALFCLPQYNQSFSHQHMTLKNHKESHLDKSFSF